ncbi:MAG: hypothetical protein IPG07_13770 [Crocinitomicaceae bacterium]|nr:hypothetical protein [Crocinitomicaceae bacterium]
MHSISRILQRDGSGAGSELVLCMQCSCHFLTIDYFADGSSETIEATDLSIAHHNHVISAKEENFRVHDHDYWNSDYYGQVCGNRSPLFHDLKSISLVLDPPDLTIRKHSDILVRFDSFDKYELVTIMSFNSMYGVFPFVHIFYWLLWC